MWKFFEDKKADGTGEVRDDCPTKAEGTVCAFEYGGKLYHTKDEIEVAKKREREAEMMGILIDIADRDMLCKRYSYSGMHSQPSARSVGDFMMRNADAISKALQEGVK